MAKTNSSEFSEGSDQDLDTVVQATTNVIYLKIMILALPLIYLLSWVPKIDVIGYWGFLLLLVILAITAIIWWRKYRSIRTDDIFFKKAKRIPLIALVVCGVMFVVWIVAPILYLSHQLSSLSESPSTVVVLEDSDGTYWAVHSSMIKKNSWNTIIIKKDTTVAKDAEGHGNVGELWLKAPKGRGLQRGIIGIGSAGLVNMKIDTEVKVKRIVTTFKY